MRRRVLLVGAAAGLGAGALGRAGSSTTRPPKVLRVAFNSAEAGFDPVQVGDLWSNTINAHIFESPLTYDYLARPARLVPQTAAALPEVADDFRRYVVTIRPGIQFADDAAFGGAARELTAADHVHSIKRFYDPRLKTEQLYQFENVKVLGLSELRQRALAAKAPLDYDAPVEGLRVLDRYRFEVRLAEAAPRFVHLLASPQLTGALAPEVVEQYGDDVMAHPVGTGPFRLAAWRRGSSIVLERNPRFRDQRFAAEPPAGDAGAQAIAARLAGRRLPLLDRIEVSIVDEAQPRWLAFAGGELDVLELPPEFAPVALPGGTLAAPLARRGVRAEPTLNADVTHTFFNCTDETVGGYAPANVALRRSVALACDSAAEVRLVQRG